MNTYLPTYLPTDPATCCPGRIQRWVSKACNEVAQCSQVEYQSLIGANPSMERTGPGMTKHPSCAPPWPVCAQHGPVVNMWSGAQTCVDNVVRHEPDSQACPQTWAAEQHLRNGSRRKLRRASRRACIHTCTRAFRHAYLPISRRM